MEKESRSTCLRKGGGTGILKRERADILCLRVFILFFFFKARVLGEISGEGLNRTFISFPFVHFDVLMHQNECRGVWDHSLASFTALLLSWVCLALIGFLLFIPLTSSVLRFGWH